jgi:hypothetical protein
VTYFKDCFIAILIVDCFFAGENSGHTTLGHTGWTGHTTKSIYADINTLSAHFSDTPIYVTSLLGSNGQIPVVGSHSIYRARKEEFRVYLRFGIGVAPQTAEERHWAINWIGCHPAGASITSPVGSSVVLIIFHTQNRTLVRLKFW